MKSKTIRLNRAFPSLILFFALLLTGSFLLGTGGYPVSAQNGGNGGNGEELSFRERCNFIQNEDKRKECKRRVTGCNPPPEALSEVTPCKREVMRDFQDEIRAGQQAAQQGGGGQGGQGAGGQGGQGGGGGGAQGEIVLGTQGSHQCGNLPTEEDNWKTKLNFGCLGKQGPSGLGPIQDLLFALIRFLSIGVGVVLTLSIVAAGVQYSSSEGNADATQKAKKRIQNAIIGLAIFIFAWTILQFLIPGGLFKPGDWLIETEYIIRGLL